MQGLKYRLQRIEPTQTNKNLQTAEKSRGWLGFRRFSDQMNRLRATYFWKTIRKNETNEKFLKNSKILMFRFST